MEDRANNSGADLSGLIRQATLCSLSKVFQARESAQQPSESRHIVVSMADFDEAFDSVRPSVSDTDRKRYENLRTFFDIPR